MDRLKRETCRLLDERGIQLPQIAELVYFLQKDYIPDLDLNMCLEQVNHVLGKRDVQNAVITGIVLDKLAENNMLEEPLQSFIRRDESLYGIDEVLALAILNIYGSIGLTNFGYIDKLKPGILSRLDDKANGCNTFLDDIVGAVAAAASSRLAHEMTGEHM